MRQCWSLAGVVLLCAASSAHAAFITATGTQSGFDGFSASPYPVSGAPLDYTGQGPLPVIASIEVTMTIFDGDTDLGDFDFDQLSLALDGIDTGLFVNGFTNDALVTLTISGPISAGVSAALLAALADNLLDVTLIDLSPDDNLIAFTSDASVTVTLSDVSPVPEPATAALLGFGLACLAVRRLRRRT